MDDSLLQYLDKSIADLCEYEDGLLLLNFAFFLHVASEVSPITELLHNIVIVCAFHDIQKSNNVWTFQCFKYVDFSK